MYILILSLTVIDSTDEKYINDTIIQLKEIEKKKIQEKNYKDKNERLKEIDNIPLYIAGKGLCIGNMISQVVATFYLDELDKFIQEKLQIKAYGRYMDDFYCISENKNFLKECLEKIKKFLENYKLELNRKTKIYSSKENIEFLGFMFSSKNHNIRMKLTNKTKKKFKVKMKKRNRELLNHKIKFSEYRQVRDSYRGHLSYGNCNYLYNKYTVKSNI